MSKNEPQGCLFSILKILGISPGNQNADEQLPYKRKDYLLTKAERLFFEVLQVAVKERYLIFAMVRLADLIIIPRGTESRQKYFNKIQSKHIDFVLCDPKTIRPLLAIELDDSSHNRSDRRARDLFVNQALESAGLALLRVKTSNSYNAEDLTRSIDEQIES